MWTGLVTANLSSSINNFPSSKLFTLRGWWRENRIREDESHVENWQLCLLHVESSLSINDFSVLTITLITLHLRYNQHFDCPFFLHHISFDIKESMTVNTCSTKNICPYHNDGSAVIIDIPEELEPDLNTTCWIYRVPRNLRQLNEAAYTPRLVSIGPFHHGQPKFRAMEAHKTKYQHQFWERDFCKHLVEKTKVPVGHDFMKFIGDEFMKQGDRIKRVRGCYAGISDKLETKDGDNGDEDHFSDMIFKDACFIFELFLRNHETNKNDAADPTDYILRTPWLRIGIELDLMLLENQLPFFILKELFDFILCAQPPDEEPTNIQRQHFMSKLVIEFFDAHYFYGRPQVLDREEIMEKKPQWDPLATNQVPYHLGPDTQAETFNIPTVLDLVITAHELARFGRIKHFTDLVRNFMLPEERTSICSSQRAEKKKRQLPTCTSSSRKAGDNFIKIMELLEQYSRPNKKSPSIKCSPSAKKLDRAGVNFVACKKRYLAEIRTNRDDGTRMPCTSLKVFVHKFEVGDETECVIRNLMALEQCLYPWEAHICNYISLLDQLINTAEDVELLIEKGILENLLGSNEAVANMFNKLCDEIPTKGFYYDGLCKLLNEHYESFWSHTKATLKRVYFKDLWTGSSTVVGFLVTLFSIVNIITSIKITL